MFLVTASLAHAVVTLPAGVDMLKGAALANLVGVWGHGANGWATFPSPYTLDGGQPETVSVTRVGSVLELDTLNPLQGNGRTCLTKGCYTGSVTDLSLVDDPELLDLVGTNHLVLTERTAGLGLAFTSDDDPDHFQGDGADSGLLQVIRDHWQGDGADSGLRHTGAADVHCGVIDFPDLLEFKDDETPWCASLTQAFEVQLSRTDTVAFEGRIVRVGAKALREGGSADDLTLACVAFDADGRVAGFVTYREQSRNSRGSVGNMIAGFMDYTDDSCLTR